MRTNAYILILFFACTLSCKHRAVKNEEPVVAPDTVKAVVNLEYELPVDSFLITKGRVKRNQFLSNILSAYGVSYQTIDKLAREYKEVFDVRQIRVGNPYALFQTKDSIPKLVYFIYEKSQWEYVVYDFRDGVNIYTGKKPVETKLQTANGVVTSSLWNSMVDKGYNPFLAVELSEIYAWSIDFFGIAKGDKFRVAYLEDFVDSSSIGITKILAAEFHHMGHNYYAIPFVQDSISSFYDEDGNSLRKAFLKAPLKYSRISSKYSLHRYHPVLKYFRPHQGVDYAAPYGTPVQSIGDGTIIKRGYQKNGGGNYLYIKHNSVYTTIYMHLQGFSKGMYVGKRVAQGETIGFVGSTGLASGPHLDFRVSKNGSLVNPLKVKAPPVKPISESNKAAFENEKARILSILNAIKW